MEINKAIDKRLACNNTVGLNWNNVGINNDFQPLDAIETYKMSNDIFFNLLEIKKHIRDINIMDGCIVFNLNWKMMKEMDEDWEYILVNEFLVNVIFHDYESVIINRKYTNKHRINKHGNGNNNNGNNNNHVLLIKKIPVGLATRNYKLKENKQIEAMITYLLDSRNIITKEMIVKVQFMKKKKKNENFDISNIIDKEFNVVMGKIQIEKFVSAIERKWKNGYPLFAITQQCYTCKMVDHDIGNEIIRLKLGFQENTKQFKQELKKWRPPDICRKCSMIGHHKTSEYKKCEKVKLTLMKNMEYLIMRYGKEINVELILILQLMELKIYSKKKWQRKRIHGEEKKRKTN